MLMADHATLPADLPPLHTLLVWTMSIDEHRATCLLTRVSAEYEAGVVIDEGVAITARAGDAEEILRLADQWHAKLCSAGWVPDNLGVKLVPKPDRRRFRPA